MSWVSADDRLPKHNQWVAIPWGDGFKVGQFSKDHPFSPCIVDRQEGKFYRYFKHWKPLNTPKVKQ